MFELRKSTSRESSKSSCHNTIVLLDPISRCSLLNTLAVERLERKARDLYQIYLDTNSDWQQTLFVALARTIGDLKNRENYTELARRVTLRNIMRERSSKIRVEALLFGTSGLLSTVSRNDSYISQLREEFNYLSHKYSIESMESKVWSTMLSRPANHPRLRLSELASLLTGESFSLESIIGCSTTEDVERLFKTEASQYWSSYFSHTASTDHTIKRLGNEKAHIIGINLVVVIQFLYGRLTGKCSIVDRALDLWERLPAEKNRYTTEWSSAGLSIHNAYESQAILQLSREYCEQKRCDNCPLMCYANL